ncbi:MAG: hypothetical protein KDA84_26330 [Planctomycetaceae bacterium]|nr:hypothetical protein [Planctomycetaceae bacterium]
MNHSSTLVDPHRSPSSSPWGGRVVCLCGIVLLANGQSSWNAVRITGHFLLGRMVQ